MIRRHRQNPVYLSERGAGPGQANSTARDLLRGLGFPVTDSGEIAAGADTALAYDVLAADLTNEDRKRQLLDVADYALSVGLTTVMDMSGTVPGVGFIDQTNGYDFFLDLVREGSHKVRTRIYFPGLDEDEETDATHGLPRQQMAQLRSGDGEDRRHRRVVGGPFALQ